MTDFVVGVQGFKRINMPAGLNYLYMIESILTPIVAIVAN